MRPQSSRFGTLLRTFVIFVVAVVVGGIAVGACLAALIPGTVEIATAHHYTAGTVKNLRSLSQQSTVYWNDGVTPMPCGQLGIEVHDPITSVADVPPRLVNAVIATEDRSFWTNAGIDLGGVFRAFVTNVVSGRIEQGGSTITQQLVKKRILSDKRDVHRKLKEIIYALRLNDKFSKDKILTEYLNTVYFGENSYGIKSAAERFFTIAGSRRRPTASAARRWPSSRSARPRSSRARSTTRSATIPSCTPIRRSCAAPRCSRARSRPATSRRPRPTPRTRSRCRSSRLRPSCGRATTSSPRCATSCSPTPRSARRPTSGATRCCAAGSRSCRPSISTLQAEAQDATDNAKPQKGPDWISSLVSIDPSTGFVKAMIGGPDFADSQYNIATHPIGRQPGSTWKVITLAGALQNGYSPDDIVDGTSPCSVPKIFPGKDATTVNAEEGGGPLSLWDATAGSVELRVRPAVDQRRAGAG